MKISGNGIAIVKAFESCLRPVGGGKFKAYVDPVGVLTIGFGHTNHHEPKFTASTIWTQMQCDVALAGDMATFEEHVSKLANVDLEQHEFDALVSWAFNTGGPKTATLWKRLNAGDKKAIPNELAKWNKGGGRELAGLTRRRKAEAQLFAGDVVAAFKTAQISAKPQNGTNKPATIAEKVPPKSETQPESPPQKPASFYRFIMSIIGRR